MSTANPTAAHPKAPTVISVRRDTMSREIRLELAEWRTRTGGVYDLTPEHQEALLLDGYLPGWDRFLPDFVIVLALGEPSTLITPDGHIETVTWTDLRVHVGGLPAATLASSSARRAASPISVDWYSLDALLGRRHQPGAPSWLLDLIRRETPWGALLDTPGAGDVQ